MHLQASLSIAFSLVLLMGCSRSSGGRIEVRDGVAVCIHETTGREFKLGNVKGDDVTLFATYGGTTVPMKDVENAVASVKSDPKSLDERDALIKVLRSLHVTGIWLMESAEIDGKQEVAREEDPDYLVLRPDQTFKVINKGRKPEGTWSQTADQEFLLNMDDGKGGIKAKAKWPAPDKLEVTMNDGDDLVLVKYRRTDLTIEPKAADEY